ncbi:hypothetical protein GCM10027040_31080 [Halomonas shantousis]
MSENILDGLGSLNVSNWKKKPSKTQDSMAQGEITSISLDAIVVEDQVRKSFDNIEELAADIEAKGQRTPLEVASLGNDQYLLITGERRFRALKHNHAAEAKVVLVPMPQDQVERITWQLTENIQRAELTPQELAVSFDALLGLGLNQRQIAQAINKSTSWVNKHLSLLKLPMLILSLLEEGVTRDINALHLLRQIHDLDESAAQALIAQLRNDEIGRSDIEIALKQLKQPPSASPKEKSLQVEAESAVKDVQTYHYQRRYQSIQPAEARISVEAKLVDGAKVTGVLMLDRMDEEAGWVWIKTVEGEEVGVPMKDIRMRQLTV